MTADGTLLVDVSADGHLNPAAALHALLATSSRDNRRVAGLVGERHESEWHKYRKGKSSPSADRVAAWCEASGAVLRTEGGRWFAQWPIADSDDTADPKLTAAARECLREALRREPTDAELARIIDADGALGVLEVLDQLTSDRDNPTRSDP